MTKRIVRGATAVFALTALVACGGGGDSTPNANNNTGGSSAGGNSVVLSGSAATGLAMGSAAVQIKCATGNGTAVTNNNGGYTATIANAALPCVLKVVSSDGLITLHSVAAGSGGGTVVANITPLTELILAAATGQTSTAFFNSFTSAQAASVQASSLDAAVVAVAAAINSSVQIGALNPLTAPLVPATPGNLNGGNTYDQLLDQLKTSITNSGTTLATYTSSLTSNLSSGYSTLSYRADMSTYELNGFSSSGAPVNSVYSFINQSRVLFNGQWASQSSSDPNLYLAASGWQSESGTGTTTNLQQTGANAFTVASGGRTQNLTFTFTDITSFDLAEAGGSLTGTVQVPTGSKRLEGTYKYVGDEYKLNGGSGFVGETSLTSFVTNRIGGNTEFGWMGGSLNGSSDLTWVFKTGGVLEVYDRSPACASNCQRANGSWAYSTVNSQMLLMITLPAVTRSGSGTGDASGLVAGENFFYAVRPGGFVQEGVFTPNSAQATKNFRKYNPTAMNVILAEARLPARPF